jgi:hypothetical protein
MACDSNLRGSSLLKARKIFRQNLVFFAFIASVFLFAVTKIHDPDAWIHLSFGHLIWEHKGVPETELFVYPSSGMPALYSSWLFGLAFYLAYLAFGGYGIVLLKAAIISTAFLFLYRDAIRPVRNEFVAVCFLSATVLFIQYRFILRPDIVLMLYLSWTIFSLNALLFDGKKYYLFMPLVALLWANTHSSIVIMTVPFLAFIAGGMVQRFLVSKGFRSPVLNNSQLKSIALVFCVSIAVSFLSPYGLTQITYAAKMLASETFKTKIFELMPAAGTERLIVYTFDVVVILSFALRGRRFSVIHALMVLPFLWVPFVSRRFLILLFMVGTPVAIRNISGFLAAEGWDRVFRGKRPARLAIFWITLSTLLSFANVQPFAPIGTEHGFGFDEKYMPKGAVAYLDRYGIIGRVLNSGIFGQYIIWKSYPERMIFADSREYLPEDLRGISDAYRFDYRLLDALQRRYGFETMVIEYPLDKFAGYTGPMTYDVAFSHPAWALVYWDDIALVYLKRGGAYESVIRKDEYHLIKPEMSARYFADVYMRRSGKEAALKELRRNLEETGSRRAREFFDLLSDVP